MDLLTESRWTNPGLIPINKKVEEDWMNDVISHTNIQWPIKVLISLSVKQIQRFQCTSKLVGLVSMFLCDSNDILLCFSLVKWGCR